MQQIEDTNENMLIIHKQISIEQLQSIYKQRNDRLGTLMRHLLKLYEKQKSVQAKYETRRFMLFLNQLTQQQFDQEFQQDKNDQTQLIVQSLTESWIKNVEQLRINATISKYLEFSYINLSFNNQFIVEAIPNNVLKCLFMNIDTRLQKIDSLIDFIIIYDINTDTIFKQSLNGGSGLTAFIKEIGFRLCDVIIASSSKYDNIQSLNIRYLNYIGRDYEITLQFPESLITAILCNVRVQNLNQCLNIKNLYSEKNTYHPQDISALFNIKRLYSMLDTYIDTDVSMIEQLFSTNEIEYLSIIQEDDPDANIINNCILNNNIQNLRYVYIFSESYCKVTLDIGQQPLCNLLVYNVTSVDESQNEIYGTISGSISAIKQIEHQIIHSINQDSNIIT